MAMEDHDRPVPRVFEKDRSIPIREEGLGTQGYMIIGAILAVIVFVGASFYGANSPSSPNTPGADRQVTTPTQTPAR
jgi:hypothetical protein